MSARLMLSSVPHHLLRWIRDESGTVHAVKQSEGVHCSCHCRKYVRGETFTIGKGGLVLNKCRDCVAKLENPIALSSGPRIARAVLLGHGVQDELRRRSKGRD